MGPRRGFKRPIPTRRYRRMFILATEGSATEPQYFDLFNSNKTVIHVKYLKGKTQSAPFQVLTRMEKHLKKQVLRPEDEAWLIVDKDNWSEAQLQDLHCWSQTSDQYGFAVSNPKFELWLLLHFEDANGIATSRQCTERLIRHLPNFSKGHVDIKRFTGNIDAAIQRAKRKDSPPCSDWPRQTGTTVYKLVERILSTEN